MWDFEYGLQDDELTITLTLDDDSEVECSVVAIIPVWNQDYIVLLPLDCDTDEVYIYRFKSRGDDIVLEDIVDDEEFEQVSDAYDALYETEPDDFFDDFNFDLD